MLWACHRWGRTSRPTILNLNSNQGQSNSQQAATIRAIAALISAAWSISPKTYLKKTTFPQSPTHNDAQRRAFRQQTIKGRLTYFKILIRSIASRNQTTSWNSQFCLPVSASNSLRNMMKGTDSRKPALTLLMMIQVATCQRVVILRSTQLVRLSLSSAILVEDRLMLLR